MPGIGVVTNLNSTRNKGGAFSREKMEAVLGPDGISRDTRTLKDIPRVIGEFRERGVEIICINGGDGTQHHTANGILRVYGEKGPFPALVPLRGGVMNMLAKNFIGKGSPSESLVRVRDAYLASKNTGAPLPKRTCGTIMVSCPALEWKGVGFVYGTGIVHTLLRKYYEGGVPSFRNAVNVVTSAIGGFVLGSRSARSAFEHVEARITVEGRPLPFPTILIAAASVVPNLILWFRPFLKGTPPPDTPGFYFMANDMNNWDVIRNVRGLSRGLLNSHEKLFNGFVGSVGIETACGFTLDGEVFTPPRRTEVSLSPGPMFTFLTL